MLDFLWIMPFNKKSLQITKAAKHNIAFEHLRKYIFLYVIKFINIPFMSIQNQLKIYMHNKCLFCLFAAYFLKTNCEIIIYIQGIKIYITQILNTTHWGWLEWRREYEGEKQNVNGVDNGLGYLLLLHVWNSIRQQLIGVLNRRSLCFFHYFLKRKQNIFLNKIFSTTDF